MSFPPEPGELYGLRLSQSSNLRVAVNSLTKFQKARRRSNEQLPLYFRRNQSNLSPVAFARSGR